MSEKVVSVRLKFNDDGTVAGAERVSAAMKKVATANDEAGSSAKRAGTGFDALFSSDSMGNLTRMPDAIKKVAVEASSLEGVLNSVKTAVEGFIAAWGFSKILAEMKSITMAGVEFNSILQQSALAMRATSAG